VALARRGGPLTLAYGTSALKTLFECLPPHAAISDERNKARLLLRDLAMRRPLAPTLPFRPPDASGFLGPAIGAPAAAIGEPGRSTNWTRV
jgi:hypothetical protein